MLNLINQIVDLVSDDLHLVHGLLAPLDHGVVINGELALFVRINHPVDLKNSAALFRGTASAAVVSLGEVEIPLAPRHVVSARVGAKPIGGCAINICRTINSVDSEEVLVAVVVESAGGGFVGNAEDLLVFEEGVLVPGGKIGSLGEDLLEN